jgi:ATP-dependent Clp protease adaptor protein ClpS
MLVDLASELWPVKFLETETKTFNESLLPARGYADNYGILEELSTRVILYNDNIHTFDEVIGQVCKATGCVRQLGSAVAWEVHTRGLALVFKGDMFECLQVSSVLEEIELHTQVMT